MIWSTTEGAQALNSSASSFDMQAPKIPKIPTTSVSIRPMLDPPAAASAPGSPPLRAFLLSRSLGKSAGADGPTRAGRRFPTLAGVAGHLAPDHYAAMGAAIDQSVDRAVRVAVHDDRGVADIAS